MVSRQDGYTKDARKFAEDASNEIKLTTIYDIEDVLDKLPLNKYALDEVALMDLTNKMLREMRRLQTRITKNREEDIIFRRQVISYISLLVYVFILWVLIDTIIKLKPHFF